MLYDILNHSSVFKFISIFDNLLFKSYIILYIRSQRMPLVKSYWIYLFDLLLIYEYLAVEFYYYYMFKKSQNFE